MPKFGVIIRREKKDIVGYPIVIAEKNLKGVGYRRDHDFIIKLGLTENEAKKLVFKIQVNLFDLHKATSIDIKELINRIFFGGE